MLHSLHAGYTAAHGYEMSNKLFECSLIVSGKLTPRKSVNQTGKLASHLTDRCNPIMQSRQTVAGIIRSVSRSLQRQMESYAPACTCREVTLEAGLIDGPSRNLESSLFPSSTALRLSARRDHVEHTVGTAHW